MPSLRMKKNSSMCCLRESDCLNVCKKSNMIAKRSSSNVKISQLLSEAGTCQSCEDVPPSSDLDNHGTGIIGATNSDELLGGEDIQVERSLSFSDDCIVVERMESPTISCSANLGTIFSPTLSHIDARNVPSSYDSAECNIDQDPYQCSTVDESDDNSGSSSDHQTCNISDFYISDMDLAGLPFDGSPFCDGVAETLIFPEYDTAESNIFFDITDGRMTSPFLDDFADASERLDVQSSGEERVECDGSSFLLAIHQIRPGDEEADVRPYIDSDDGQSFDPHSFIRNLPDLSDVVQSARPTMLPKESREKKSVTLVLDLDETLVHSTLEHCEDADFTFTVFFNMKEHTVYVKERPHLQEFLKKVATMFEVVVFTASQSIYAEQLLDILDPDGKLISGRAYRESCIFSDGSYTKDLTVLGLDLAKVVIIDNSPQVFRLQVNNGIPIKSWFDDPSDNELVSLIPFLETLAVADDVRPIIAKRFGNKD